LEVGGEYKTQLDKLFSLSERQTLPNGVYIETKLRRVGKALPDARPNADMWEKGETDGKRSAELVFGNEKGLQ
jgi:hypothetical protein